MDSTTRKGSSSSKEDALSLCFQPLKMSIIPSTGGHPCTPVTTIEQNRIHAKTNLSSIIKCSRFPHTSSHFILTTVLQNLLLQKNNSVSFVIFVSQILREAKIESAHLEPLM